MAAPVAAYAGRNWLRNGRLMLSQRGASFSVVAPVYTADGWLLSSTATSTVAVSAADTRFAGSRFLAISGSQGANGVVTVAQRVEAANAANLVGRSVTVSFHASASTSAGGFSAAVNLGYASAADTFGTVTAIGSVAVTLTGSVARITATFPTLPSGAANGLQVSLAVTQTGGSGTLAVNVGGAQLEPGGVATALEYLPLAAEFEICRRYYQTCSVYSAGYAPSGTTVGGGPAARCRGWAR